MASRVARLTLFSGPQCSLCEIAKAELAKVRKQRAFHLEVINIQEKGQEKWKKNQGSLGRLYGVRSAEETRGKSPAREIDRIVNDSFIVDTTPSISSAPPCLYDRIPGIALGEEEVELLLSAVQDLRLCFNCGSPNHAVASCPDPINRQLVSLSRQFFDFLHPDSGGREFTRFYIVEGWKQQRLAWLKSYEPGVIHGSLLRDALGLQGGDPGNAVEWLRNMAYWGYPPGWIGRRNPKELVFHRIQEDEANGQIASTDYDSFTIIQGADDDEEIDLGLFSPKGFSVVTGNASVDEEKTRWATYPDTYFSSTLLSSYSGTPLDRAASPPIRVSVTFTPERKALWERILSGSLGASHSLSVPPWRMPSAFGASSCPAIGDLTPPPPPTTPPPLPHTLKSPLHPFNAQRSLVPSRESAAFFMPEEMIDAAADGSLVDMDVSDSE